MDKGKKRRETTKELEDMYTNCMCICGIQCVCMQTEAEEIRASDCRQITRILT